jgi:CheY-like chemotaxis protein
VNVDLRTRFGTTVKARRKSLGISQERLAERAGLHRTYVADVERGARNLSLASIEKLAKALDLSLPGLFAHAVPEGVPATSASAVEILLVEDDPSDVELALRAFEAAKLLNPVHVVRDGAEALDYLFQNASHLPNPNAPPQVVLLDLCLPKVGGIEVLRRIKADPQTRSIPVAIITASLREQDAAECLRLGAEACILKPVDFSGLAAAAPQLKLSWSLLSPPTLGRTRDVQPLQSS